ncbi:phosphoribosylanthranilate isomerase [Cellvibrio sp. OA-2007]|uniref:phosphoribosylanthranilate isomerase n=1 Tax=Cellvibrio sp. OA-2007 TaxID=529823 RepID=UPI000783C6A4|nr:phosphoribosylanthranilate isomerase [Cellvibrio sp. OA-2007]
MSRARVKICGITNLEDANAVVAAGAEALGLVFYAASPRAVGIEQARAIALAAGPFTVVTGLFVNADPEFVTAVLNQVPLQLLQFHGDEDLAYCESFARPYMKAIRMRPELDVAAAIAQYPSASGILLDAYRAGVPGGTGETFDWARVPQFSTTPLVLAGGLTSANVASAIQATQVYGVDVSGGVESAPGKKDHGKITSFIHNARHAAA